VTGTRIAAVADLASVVLFVVIGRRSHDEGEAARELLKTLAPFLIGLVAGWTVLIATARRAVAWRSGVIVWISTVVVGMLLRRLAFNRGTALSFVVVATVFLGVFVVGWRLAAERFAPWGRHRAAG